MKYDVAIVGSGMGGSMIASLCKNRNIVVFEKDANLGGCAGTFQKKGVYYNVGATTFMGYEEGHPIRNIFDEKKIHLTQSNVAIRILQGNKQIDRSENFDKFLEDINRLYPNKNNTIFWTKLHGIDKKFWSLKKLFYGKYSFSSYLKTLVSSVELVKVFGIDLFKSADGFIKETLGEISKEYRDFIDAGLLITVQSSSRGLPLLSLALGLCYPFHKVFYVQGGMGELIGALLEDICVKQNEAIVKIKRDKNRFILSSKKDRYIAKNVILNSTIFNAYTLFNDKKIEKYYKNFTYNDQSAFVVYLHVDIQEEFFHHYQILLDESIPNSISNSFFVSISDKDDKKMSHEGYSITISTHTKASFWNNLSKEEYEAKKQETQAFIVNEFLRHITKIKKEHIKTVFSATSKTFYGYIGRTNCGGAKMSLKNILQTPSNKTPFKGLYNIGDTVFAGQGWPGVAIGVQALRWELEHTTEF